MKKVGVLVVTYNQYKITSNFVKTFLKTFKDPNIYLLVLDNNSSDNTFEKIRKSFPDVDIRKTNDNYGCVTGRNIGIAELYKLGCDFVYISDNDVSIDDQQFFKKMVNFCEKHPSVDGCCPVVRNGLDRTIQTLGSRYNKPGIVRNVKNISEDTRVDILPGCAQFMRIDTYKRIGLYDNDLSPISMEDFEWGIRGRKKEVNLVYNPQVEVFHYNRLRKDSRQKRNYVIIGRTLYLRQNFTFHRLLQDLIFMLNSVKDYGLIFSLRGYLEGFKKKISFENYHFDKFLQKGLDRYYEKK